MNKKLLISMLLMSVFIIGINSANAQEVRKDIQKPMAYHKTDIKPPYKAPETQKNVPALKYFGPGPQIDKNHPMQVNFPKYRTKADMEAKKAEFEKRLNLSEEQKNKIEQNRIKDREKIKPIIEEMKAKHKELRSIKEDETLSLEQKQKKIDKIGKDLKALRVKADNCRKENMKEFESILTKEQKNEFGKIKSEQKQKMEERRKHFEQMKKEHQQRMEEHHKKMHELKNGANINLDEKKPSVEPKPVIEE